MAGTKQLLELRNKKLIERYFYWTEVKRRRFDDVLRILETEEFFIGQQRIMIILRSHSDMIDELIARKSKQPKKQLDLFENA